VVGTGTQVSSATIPLTAAVNAGDLLVGWFGQYSSSGQVHVSDNINGAWTRSASETWSNGGGDLALYYVQNAASAASGLTVTIAASTATYLEGAASDYSGVAQIVALDKVAVSKGVSAAADSGATTAVGSGELVVGGIITGVSPGAASAGATQGQTFIMRAQTSSGSVDIEDVLAGNAGAQNGRATLGTSTDWYAVAAVFLPLPPPAPTGLTASPVSSTQISLSWTASSGASGYKIQRSLDGSTGWIQVGTSTTPSFTDAGLSPSTHYFYRVAATNGIDDSIPSIVASATTLATPGLLRVATNPAVPTQITVDGNIADTWGLSWPEFPPGSHTVCFSSIEGYTTPACQTVSVSSGVTTTVTGTFIQRGFLRVLTSPTLQSTISVDGTPMDDWGLWTDVATGSHQVCFGLVPNYTPPACQAVTVSAGATTTVTGTFTSSPGAPGQTNVGLLRVTTSPAVASQITVDGNIGDTWGLNWLEIGSGSHTICFASVQGYTTPACQTVTVSAGATTTVTGSFVQRGFLRVLTSPAVAGTIFVNGIPSDAWGLWTDMPTGTYQVCFAVVSGYANTPACQSAVVSAGATTTVTGTYS
jgi:hypothetical protein